MEGITMIVSNEFEKMPSNTAGVNMAKHLADSLRAAWLSNTAKGLDRWEFTYFEEPAAIEFVRDENFPNLHGIDYIFKWWGNQDTQSENTSGQLEVIWKVYSKDDAISLYRTYIYFSDYDFELGMLENETARRESFENKIVQVFADWEEEYRKNIVK